jgi:hypothetical protein
MSPRLAILAEPAAGGLSGLDGRFDWGEAATLAPGDPLPKPAPDFVVALEGADALPGGEPDVRWLAAGAQEGQATRDATGRRLVAPSGDRLWSRAPLPVRDELFDLPPAAAGAAVLVVTTDELRNAPLLEKLAARGLPLRTAPRLTADGLASAGTVAFPPSVRAGGPVWEREDALPAAAIAVLAARRFLIAPRAGVTFGLQPGVDHLAASTDEEVVQYADAVGTFPESFALQVALGRIAAERQRASVVYGRLVVDLVAGSTAARRSAAPRG